MRQAHANYTFNASTKTITLTGLNIAQDQLLLVTNATRGVIYYNFASSSHRAVVTAGANTTVNIIDASTTEHDNSDKLIIHYETQNEPTGAPDEGMAATDTATSGLVGLVKRVNVHLAAFRDEIGGGTNAITKEYYVSGLQIINPGSGYTPGATLTLVFSGGNPTTAASAVAIVGADGRLSAVSLISGGYGYQSAPSVSVAGAGGASIEVIMQKTLASNFLSQIKEGIKNLFYGNPLIPSTTPGAISGLTGSLISSNNSQSTVRISHPYGTLTPAAPSYIVSANVPQLVFSARTTTTPRRFLLLQNSSNADMWVGLGTGLYSKPAASGAVNAVTITNGGSNYIVAPSVTFSPPPAGGTTAAGTAIISGGVVTSVVITDPGSGYTSAPTVTFSAGAPSATATATIGPNGLYLAPVPGTLGFDRGFIPNDAVYIVCGTVGKAFVALQA